MTISNEVKSGDNGRRSVPGVAAVAFNVKGTDLLFLDHLDDSELQDADRGMWDLVGVNPKLRPFGRVLVYVPLADDGLNRNSLRTNPDADIPDYSATRTFALGLDDLWPHLGLLFDSRSQPAADLLAEVRQHFTRRQGQASGFTQAGVLHFFNTVLRQPKASRSEEWKQYSSGTIESVYQRLRALSSTLGGLLDHTGTGFGLEHLADLEPFDLVVIDLERIMADPPDPELADRAVKIITRFVLQRITEAVTRGKRRVQHVIVFADELNRLAPRRGDTGVGEYLAHLARTTRDRGVILFGAGQFRSSINEDILKAAAVHYSMRTPEYELSDAIYKGLSPEFRARLTQGQPGETMLTFPSFRTPVFARFPRPFVYTGTKGTQALPPAPPRPLGECIAERLRELDALHPPLVDEVRHLLDEALTSSHGGGVETDLLRLLRDIEMSRTGPASQSQAQESPWAEFRRLVGARSASDWATDTDREQVSADEFPDDPLERFDALDKLGDLEEE